jgi:hypothetical protein
MNGSRYAFFTECAGKALLTPQGEVHVSLRTTAFYDSWDLEVRACWLLLLFCQCIFRWIDDAARGAIGGQASGHTGCFVASASAAAAAAALACSVACLPACRSCALPCSVRKLFLLSFCTYDATVLKDCGRFRGSEVREEGAVQSLRLLRVL